MNKQQRNKLIVAIGFFVLITSVSVWAYVTILKPIRDHRGERKGKYSLKGKYKTEYNPDIIDSIEAKTKAKYQQKKSN
jgi:hypothetical protein